MKVTRHNGINKTVSHSPTRKYGFHTENIAKWEKEDTCHNLLQLLAGLVDISVTAAN